MSKMLVRVAGSLEAVVFACGAALAADDFQSRWTVCVVVQAERYASQFSEPAQTVVQAAFGACQKEEFAYGMALEKARGIAGAKAEIEASKKQWIPQLLSHVLDHRIKLEDQKKARVR